jgi:ABC-type nitrate/sulfonate/bicarbonate transport system permease component
VAITATATLGVLLHMLVRRLESRLLPWKDRNARS